ncbi:hypothetical protein PS726_00209 [Pseudomonas fluorescens]|nr:hypothetical protein PS726_00209 [Pseudomonas fluorescens]
MFASRRPPYVTASQARYWRRPGFESSSVCCREGVGLPVARLVRGDTVGPDVRCLYECWAQPSGLLRHAGESVIYFMVQSPIARSLGRQWPPIEWGECRGPRCAVQNHPHRRSLESGWRVNRLRRDKIRSGSGKGGHPAISGQSAERSPMRPGAGEYQGIGKVSNLLTGSLIIYIAVGP